MSACRHAWLFSARLIGGEGAAGAESGGADYFLRLPRCEFLLSRKTCSPSFCSDAVRFGCYFSHQPCSHRFLRELQHLYLIIHFSLPGIRMEDEAASGGSVSLCVLISTCLAPRVTLRCSRWMAVKQTQTSLEHTGKFLLVCLACFSGLRCFLRVCQPVEIWKKCGTDVFLLPSRAEQNRKGDVHKQQE